MTGEQVGTFIVALVTAMSPLAIAIIGFFQLRNTRKMTALQTTLTETLGRLKDETDARENSDQQIISLKDQQKRNIHNIADVTEQLDSAQQNYATAQQENTRLSAAVDDLNRKLKTLSDQYQELSAEHDRFTRQSVVDKQKDQTLIEGLRSELLLARAETSRWQELARQYQTNNKDLQDKFDDLTRQFEALARKVDTGSLTHNTAHDPSGAVEGSPPEQKE